MSDIYLANVRISANDIRYRETRIKYYLRFTLNVLEMLRKSESFNKVTIMKCILFKIRMCKNSLTRGMLFSLRAPQNPRCKDAFRMAWVRTCRDSERRLRSATGIKEQAQKGVIHTSRHESTRGGSALYKQHYARSR